MAEKYVLHHNYYNIGDDRKRYESVIGYVFVFWQGHAFFGAKHGNRRGVGEETPEAPEQFLHQGVLTRFGPSCTNTTSSMAQTYSKVAARPNLSAVTMEFQLRARKPSPLGIVLSQSTHRVDEKIMPWSLQAQAGCREILQSTVAKDGEPPLQKLHATEQKTNAGVRKQT